MKTALIAAMFAVAVLPDSASASSFVFDPTPTPVIPVPEFHGSVLNEPGSIVQVKHGASLYQSGTGTLDIKLAPTPSVFASETKDTIYSAGSTGRVIYYFTNNGVGTDLVPILAKVFLQTQSSEAGLQTIGAELGISNSFGRAGEIAHNNETIDKTIRFFANPGDLTRVELYAHVGFYLDDSVGATGSAFADPFFSIDPEYTATHPGTTLTFSSGAANQLATSTSPVPEPATWAMMLMGFGMVGAGLRGRRKPSVRVTYA